MGPGISPPAKPVEWREMELFRIGPLTKEALNFQNLFRTPGSPELGASFEVELKEAIDSKDSFVWVIHEEHPAMVCLTENLDQGVADRLFEEAGGVGTACLCLMPSGQSFWVHSSDLREYK